MSKARSHNRTELGLTESQSDTEDYVLKHYVPKIHYSLKTITTLKWLWNTRESTRHPQNKRQQISHIHLRLFSVWQARAVADKYNEGLILHFSYATHTSVHFKYTSMSVPIFSSTLPWWGIHKANTVLLPVYLF